MSIATLLNSTFGWRSGREAAPVVSRESQFPDVADAPLDTRRLIRDRRYCLVLSTHNELDFDPTSVDCAWRALNYEMAYVPGGEVRLLHDSVIEQDRKYCLEQHSSELVTVEPFFLDRDCITNADYARFVQAGGYELAQLWPEEVLPWVLQFSDRTGQMGPKYWNDGKPPNEKLDHPVVGICWYEANAYARWAGKRLPSSAEWQRAGTWPKSGSGGAEQRYPWGNAFEISRANLWKQNHCETLAVDALDVGNTPNGVRQLIGNVWEWLSEQYCPATDGEAIVILEETMAEIRGGAFDTYFTSQANCQFRTGHPTLNRSPNVGFRCCVSTDALASRTAEDSVETDQ